MPVWIFLLAGVLRLVFIWQWLGTPYGQIPFLDAHAYDQWAKAIADGHLFRATAFYQNPLYPYVVALIYKTVAHSTALIAWLQAILGAATCALIAHTTRVHFGRAAGIAAGVLASLDRTLIFYCAPLLKESLGLFLFAVFVHLALSAHNKGRLRLYFLSGIFLGLTALVRTNVLLLPIGLIFWERSALKLWRKYGCLVFGVCLSILPVTLHNWVVSHDFVLINYAGGFNLFVGNSPSAQDFTYPPGVSTETLQEEKDTIRIAETDAHRSLKPSEISAYWSHKALEFIVNDPISTIKLDFKKLWLFFSNSEFADNYDINFINKNFTTVLNWAAVGFSILAALAAIGFCLSWRKPEVQGLGVLLILYTLSVVLFYVTDRYRLPAVILLLPMAGCGVVKLLEKKGLVRACALAIPVLIIGYYPVPRVVQLEAFNWGTLASLNSDQGNDPAAVHAIEKAVAAGSERVDASAFVKASTSYERLGRLTDAENMLRKAVEIHPDDGLTYFNYGRFKYEHDDLPGALELYNRAVVVAPWLHQPYIGLALLYIRQNQRDRALASVQKGLSLNPDDPTLHQILGLLNEPR